MSGHHWPPPKPARRHLGAAHARVNTRSRRSSASAATARDGRRSSLVLACRRGPLRPPAAQPGWWARPCCLMVTLGMPCSRAGAHSPCSCAQQQRRRGRAARRLGGLAVLLQSACTRGAVATGRRQGACGRAAIQTLATTVTHDAHTVITQSPCASCCITNSPLLWREGAAKLLIALRNGMGEASARATSKARRRSRQARRCARHCVRSTCQCSSGGAAR